MTWKIRLLNSTLGHECDTFDSLHAHSRSGHLRWSRAANVETAFRRSVVGERGASEVRSGKRSARSLPKAPSGGDPDRPVRVNQVFARGNTVAWSGMARIQLNRPQEPRNGYPPDFARVLVGWADPTPRAVERSAQLAFVCKTARSTASSPTIRQRGISIRLFLEALASAGPASTSQLRGRRRVTPSGAGAPGTGRSATRTGQRRRSTAALRRSGDHPRRARRGLR